MKDREHKQSQLSKGITKDPHRLGSNKMGKIQKSQIGQQIILRRPTHNNTWIYQLKQVRIRKIPQQSKQGQSQKSKQTHNGKKTKQQLKYSRKWSSKHEIWGEEMRTHTFSLKIWRWKSTEMEFVENDTECLGEFQLREKWGR